jgi:hypothetical protein
MELLIMHFLYSSQTHSIRSVTNKVLYATFQSIMGSNCCGPHALHFLQLKKSRGLIKWDIQQWWQHRQSNATPVCLPSLSSRSQRKQQSSFTMNHVAVILTSFSLLKKQPTTCKYIRVKTGSDDWEKCF